MDPKQQSQSTTQPTQQPVVPTSGPKEAPKMPSLTSNEWVSPSTPEINLPKEVQEAGVEAQPVVPVVPQSAQQSGVVHAKEATPVKPVEVEPLGMSTPPSVLQHLKAAHKKVSDSLSWLVRLILKEQEKKEKHTTSGYN